ncbi:MAG: copper homeostasis protein CutC [Gemmatimonadota bacterium]
MLVEAAVESLGAAQAAAEGGAHRIELCADLAHGGTTPLLELPKVPIPVYVLIRPRAGDFVYTGAEHRVMLEQIHQAKAAGARGIVTGALTSTGQVDVARMAELIAAARPLGVTFHRAIDVSTSITAALETLIALGVDRVLTSGGAKAAVLGLETIGRLVRQSAGRIVILAGGGIDASNAARIVQKTGVQEIHFSVTIAQKVRDVLESL